MILCVKVKELDELNSDFFVFQFSWRNLKSNKKTNHVTVFTENVINLQKVSVSFS